MPRGVDRSRTAAQRAREASALRQRRAARRQFKPDEMEALRRELGALSHPAWVAGRPRRRMSRRAREVAANRAGFRDPWDADNLASGEDAAPFVPEVIWTYDQAAAGTGDPHPGRRTIDRQAAAGLAWANKAGALNIWELRRQDRERFGGIVHRPSPRARSGWVSISTLWEHAETGDSPCCPYCS